MKWKTIIFLMVFLMIAKHSYAGFGEGLFGEGVGFGEERHQQSIISGGGSSGGDTGGVGLYNDNINGCPVGKFEFNKRCIDNSFKELLNFLNETLLLQWVRPLQGPLYYQIETPTEIFAGQTIIVSNLMKNEGDLPAEVHCINFLDTNRDGIVNENEPSSTFNKRILVNNDNIVETTLTTDISLEEKSYLIGGQCEVLEGNLPNATAANKIKIKKTQNNNKPLNLGIFSNVYYLIIFLILINIIQYIGNENSRKNITRFFLFFSLLVINLIVVLMFFTLFKLQENGMLIFLGISSSIIFVHFLLDTDTILKFSKAVNLIISLIISIMLFVIYIFFI